MKITMAISVCTFIITALCIADLVTGILFSVKHFDNKNFKYNVWWWIVIQVFLILINLIWVYVKEFLVMCGCLISKSNDDNNNKENLSTTDKFKQYVKTHKIIYISSTTIAFDSFLFLLIFGCFIWGIYIFAKVHNMNINPYSKELWIWFMVNFWFTFAVFSLIFLIGLIWCCFALVLVSGSVWR